MGLCAGRQSEIQLYPLMLLTVNHLLIRYLRKEQIGQNLRSGSECNIDVANFDVSHYLNMIKSPISTSSIFKASNGDIIASYTPEGSIVKHLKILIILLLWPVSEVVFEGNEWMENGKQPYNMYIF